MYSQISKLKKNESQAVANSVGQKKGSRQQDVGFKDNRPAIISRGSGIIQAKPIDAALNDYNQAAVYWSKAAKEVQRFNNELEEFSTNLEGGRDKTLQNVVENVDKKATKAAGTLAGEAWETFQWKAYTSSSSIKGPGGHSGIDIVTFTGSGHKSSSGRGRTEVKSCRNLNSFKQGIGKAVGDDTATDIVMIVTEMTEEIRRYSDNPEEFKSNGLTFTPNTSMPTVWVEVQHNGRFYRSLPYRKSY